MTEHRISCSIEEGIARLTLQNPVGRNAIDAAFVSSFAECARRCAEDGAVDVIVIAAMGDFFSVGGDLREFLAHEKEIEAYVYGLARTFHVGVDWLYRAGAPVVLALQGMAAGGGFSLVCSADYVAAARSAKLTCAYTRTGLTPDGGASFFLERVVGYRKAFEIMALNPVLTAAEAQALGIVNEIVDDQLLEASVDTVVDRLKAVPSRAVVRLKQLMRASVGADLGDQLDREAESIARQAGVPETIDNLRSFLGAIPKRSLSQPGS